MVHFWSNAVTTRDRCPGDKARPWANRRCGSRHRPSWGKGYLEHAAHPLEAVLLCGVWSLLSHNHDPLVMQDGDREHGYSVGQRDGTVGTCQGHSGTSSLQQGTLGPCSQGAVTTSEWPSPARHLLRKAPLRDWGTAPHPTSEHQQRILRASELLRFRQHSIPILGLHV